MTAALTAAPPETKVPETEVPGTQSGKASSHIPSLDGLRAVSFGIVFLGHASAARWMPGYFGLSVFFFLSGYLITTLLRMEFDRAGGIRFRDFYLRRVLRIFRPFISFSAWTAF